MFLLDIYLESYDRNAGGPFLRYHVKQSLKLSYINGNWNDPEIIRKFLQIKFHEVSCGGPRVTSCVMAAP
jgi:hypothetical protein